MTARIVAFAGSIRRESLNTKLVNIAAKGARNAGAEVVDVKLADYSMPLYNEDIEKESGLPDNALKLKELFLNADGFLIASPEYNSGYSAVLKNMIDWLSRPSSENEAMLAAFAGKKASIMSASPGGLGGLRGLYQLRSLLMNMNVHVHPTMQAVGGASSLFDNEGNMTDTNKRDSILALGKQTVEMIG